MIVILIKSKARVEFEREKRNRLEPDLDQFQKMLLAELQKHTVGLFTRSYGGSSFSFYCENQERCSKISAYFIILRNLKVQNKYNQKRYNLAFIPINKIEQFIRLCDNGKPKPFNYILGIKSIPHVTICQFYSNSKNLDNIWTAVFKEIQKLKIILTFDKFSIKSFDKKISWLSLLPNELNELEEVYRIISKLITPIRRDKYDPHLTLLNYLSIYNPTILSEQKIFIQDEFELILGESDEIGQLTKIVKTIESLS